MEWAPTFSLPGQGRRDLRPGSQQVRAPCHLLRRFMSVLWLARTRHPICSSVVPNMRCSTQTELYFDFDALYCQHAIPDFDSKGVATGLAGRGGLRSRFGGVAIFVSTYACISSFKSISGAGIILAASIRLKLFRCSQVL